MYDGPACHTLVERLNPFGPISLLFYLAHLGLSHYYFIHLKLFMLTHCYFI
jgi:hypothetical protein